MGFNFREKIAAFKAMKRTLPIVVANAAKNHFLEGFRKGGFTDEGFDPWVKRKTKAKRNAGRAILVDTGHLRRSIRVISASFDKIEVGSTGTKYASRHNQGLDGMPKRQFIGKSGQLRKKISKIIQNKIKDSLQ